MDSYYCKVKGFGKSTIAGEPLQLQRNYDQFWKAEDSSFQDMVLVFSYLQYYGRDGVFRERRFQRERSEYQEKVEDEKIKKSEKEPEESSKKPEER